MSQTFTALSGTPAVTYCTRDGAPYRTDANGVVHVKSGAHVTELTGRGLSALTATQMAAKGHSGDPISLTVENTLDHG